MYNQGRQEGGGQEGKFALGPHSRGAHNSRTIMHDEQAMLDMYSDSCLPKYMKMHHFKCLSKTSLGENPPSPHFHYTMLQYRCTSKTVPYTITYFVSYWAPICLLAPLCTTVMVVSHSLIECFLSNGLKTCFKCTGSFYDLTLSHVH